MNIKALVISVLFVLISNCFFSFELRNVYLGKKGKLYTNILVHENNNDSTQLEFLKRLKTINQFTFQTIDSFLLQSKFTRKLEKEILFSIVQNNPETFFEVLDVQIAKYKTSRIYKIFYNSRRTGNKQDYKKVFLSIKNCKTASIYKAEILTAMTNGRKRRNRFIASTLFTPTLCLGLVLFLNLKK